MSTTHLSVGLICGTLISLPTNYSQVGSEEQLLCVRLRSNNSCHRARGTSLAWGLKNETWSRAFWENSENTVLVFQCESWKNTFHLWTSTEVWKCFLKCAGIGAKEHINICGQRRRPVPVRMVYLWNDLASWTVRSHYEIYERLCRRQPGLYQSDSPHPSFSLCFHT